MLQSKSYWTEFGMQSSEFWMLQLVLCIYHSSHWVIYPLLPFMVRDFHPTGQNEVGYMSGFVGAAFIVGSFIGSNVSVRLSDRFGLRRVLVAGLIGTITSTFSFGFATTLLDAAICRTFWGLFASGNVSILDQHFEKETNEASVLRKMTMSSAIAAIGSIIGGIVGGFFPFPADHYPSFERTLFSQFPLLLPSLIISGFCTMVLLVIVVLFLGGWSGSNITIKLAQPHSISGGYDKSPHTTLLSPTARDNLLPAESTDTTTISYFNSNYSFEEQNSSIDSELELCSPHEKDKLLAATRMRSPSHHTPAQGCTHTHQEADETAGRELRPSSIDIDTLVPNNNTRFKSKRNVSFSSAVTVRVIGSPALAISTLKQIKKDDTPLSPNNTSESSNNSTNSNNGIPSNGNSNNNIANNNNSSSNSSSNNSNNLFPSHVTGFEADSVPTISESDFPSMPSHVPSSSTTHSTSPLVSSDVTCYSNGSEFNESIQSSKQSYFFNIRYLLSRSDVFLSITLYAVYAFVIIGVIEVLPLWLTAHTAAGGFGFSSENIGLLLILSGVGVIVFLIIAYPWLVLNCGVIRVVQSAACLFIFCAIILPVLSIVNDEIPSERYTTPVAVWIGLTVIYSTARCALSMLVAGTSEMLRNCCYSHQRTSVRMIADNTASLAGTVAALAFPPIFAWSANNGLTWPLNCQLVWYQLAMVTIVNLVMSKHVRRTINRPRREPRRIDERDETMRMMVDGDSSNDGGPDVGVNSPAKDIMCKNSLGNRTYKMVSILELQEYSEENTNSILHVHDG